MARKLELFAAVLLLVASFACGQGVDRPIDWACMNCVFEDDGVTPKTIRAMFMPGPDVVVNPAAERMAAMLGREYSCTDPQLAVPECFVARNWDEGWVGKLAFRVFDNLGLTVIGLTPANFSSTSAQFYDGPSSFTRCVWEVKLGHVDICVGDFWETDERRRLVTFTSLFDLDTMRLITKRSGSSSGFEAEELLGIFKPFDPLVWAIIVANIVFASIAIYMVESGANNEDYKLEETADLVLVRIGLGILKSLWIGCVSFLTFYPSHRVNKWSGKIISFGFGFFIYVTVASYSAKLIDSLLSSVESPGRVSSLTDLIGQGGKLCMLDSIGDIVTQIPAANRVRMDDYGPMLEKLYNGPCIGAIIGKTPYQQLVLAQNATFSVCSDPRDPYGFTTCENASHTVEEINLGDCKCSGGGNPSSCPEECPSHHKYCEFLDTEDTSLNLAIGVAWPVSPPIKHFVSSWIVNFRLTGQIAILRNSYIVDRYNNVCPVLPEPSQGLSIEKLSGTYVISTALMVLGVVVFVWQNFRELPNNVRKITEEERLDTELENEGHEVEEPVPGRKGHVNPYTSVEGAIIAEMSFQLAHLGRRLDALEVNARRKGQIIFIPKKKGLANGLANGNGHNGHGRLANGNGHTANGNGHVSFGNGNDSFGNGNGNADSFAEMYATGKQVSFYEPDVGMKGLD